MTSRPDIVAPEISDVEETPEDGNPSPDIKSVMVYLEYTMRDLALLDVECARLLETIITRLGTRVTTLN